MRFKILGWRCAALVLRFCHKAYGFLGTSGHTKAAANAFAALDMSGIVDLDCIHLTAIEADAAPGAAILIDLGKVV